MAETKAKVGIFGIAAGGLALLMVLIHFWAGPFSPQPTLEQSVAEKVASIRDATVAALKGEEAEAPARRSIDLDTVFSTGAAVLGGIALILAVVAFVRHEPLRMTIGAAALGAGAIAFQFAAVALGAILFVILVAAVLHSLGIDFS